jgi:hypothetical protein
LTNSLENPGNRTTPFFRSSFTIITKEGIGEVGICLENMGYDVPDLFHDHLRMIFRTTFLY